MTGISANNKSYNMSTTTVSPNIPNPFDEGAMLLVNKPLGLTSFDVVRKIRHSTKAKKVGHAGTLDPLATGLLILCTGKMTKEINNYMGMEKTYSGEITLGSTTQSYDLESEPENFKPFSHLTEAEIFAATKPFIGDILQYPPQHSAIKKNGKPLYVSARKGIEVEVNARPISIKVFLIEKIELPRLRFKVVCSTGTYIRSLAHDFGAALGTGGHLSALRRDRIGDYSADGALELESFLPLSISDKIALVRS